MKILLIVESKKKANSISDILSGLKDKYIVLTSYGHVMDLPIKGMNIDIENNFKETYEINPNGDSFRAKAIKEIISTSKKVDQIILASDLDREGEAIAWSLKKLLQLDNPDRIVFGDTSKKTILKSLKSPQKINMCLVDSQRTRRAIDRIIGYTISPLLQKININAKSAGRVQSVAVRIIYEKEKEIEEFYKNDLNSYFKTVGTFGEYVCHLYFEGKKVELLKKEIIPFLNKAKISEFKVDDVREEISFTKPPAPFDTATLQQVCSSKLGLSGKQTMKVAQTLYEKGLITYIRTDSIVLSEEALEMCEKYIKNIYGKKYHNKMIYKNKNSSQEAHECIRPVRIEITSIDLDEEHKKVYELIWKRTVASQMSPAKIKHYIVKITGSEIKQYFETDLKKILFDGYLILYSDSDEETFSTPPKKGSKINYTKIVTSQEYIQPPLRYNDSSLNKKIQSVGFGRPSTLASIPAKILERGYVEKKNHSGKKMPSIIYTLKKEITEEKKDIYIGNEKNKYTITSLGRMVTEYLLKNFPEIMDYKYTTKVEEDLDKIANGQKKRIDVLNSFYSHFKKCLDNINDPEDRVLGEYNGNKIITKITKYGPTIKCGDKYVKLIDPVTIENITYTQALELLQQKFPIQLGTYQSKKVSINIGKYGLYLRYGSRCINLNPITEDIIDLLDLDYAKIIIDEDSINNRIIKHKGIEYRICNGKYGPYLSSGKKNYRISKEIDISKIDSKIIDKIIRKK